MVTIRLKRLGRKKTPFYRVVVVERRNSRAGRVLDTLGHYDPLPEAKQVTIDREKTQQWIARGAQLSDTVRTLLATTAN